MGEPQEIVEAERPPFQRGPPEEGGCDAEWPGGASVEEVQLFTDAAVDALATRGFFVVQVSLTDEERDQAVAQAQQIRDVKEVKEELAVDVFGRGRATKAVKLPPDNPRREPGTVLEHCDRLLTEAGLLLQQQVAAALGFLAIGRSPGLARLRFANREEAQRLHPEALSFGDEEAGLIEEHVLFVRRRKICMLLMIDVDAGFLRLFQKDGLIVSLPAGRNKLVIFRHDILSYEYLPEGGSGLALQSWMLGPMPHYILSKVEGLPEEKDEAMGIDGPVRPDGLKAQLMTAATRLPGKADSMDAYWAMVTQATDTDTKWPMERMDLDMYYTPNSDYALVMRSYTMHGGFLDHIEALGFDNTFFGIPDEEAKTMSMNQRMWMEVGYQTLVNAGFDRTTLNGKQIGIFLGDVGSDWHSYTNLFSVLCFTPEYSSTALSSAVCPGRIAYQYNMTGPTMTFDTACSASLVATHHGHMQMLNFHTWGHKYDGSLCGGVNTLGEPGYVGNCAANMLSHIGRCFTFDRTADGYQRGEGVAGFFLKLSSEHADIEDRLACLVGSCANQDGRSASLTAPNGPSQQQVIRHSLRMAGVSTNMVTAVECHGTGTALGDPIEVGALLAVLEHGRDLPLPHTSAKSNISHLESAAGVAGLLKCVIILLHSAATPNVHLRALNPHLVTAGFPQLFETELVDTGLSTGYMGVSSFGFGGTNSRGDVYGKAIRGSRQRTSYDAAKLDVVSAPCPLCAGQMCWRCGVAIPSYASRAIHRCNLLRDEWADYECCSYCYEGDFRHGSPIEDLAQWDESYGLYITGSWNAWTDMDEMEPAEEGVYVAYIALGDTRCEEFQLVVNRNPDTVFYPAVDKASSSMRIVGPDDEGKDKRWLIDGRADGSAAGTVYKVTFEWIGSRKISWEPVAQAVPELTLGTDYLHRYFLVGSWSRGCMEEMAPSGEEQGLYRHSFPIGISGTAEFHVLRDRSTAQALYPAEHGAQEGVPVRGPDADRAGRAWVVRGIRGEVANVELRVAAGHVVLTVSVPSTGDRSWESDGGAA